MRISQERNADNRSRLPGVAVSQLTRNQLFLTVQERERERERQRDRERQRQRQRQREGERERGKERRKTLWLFCHYKCKFCLRFFSPLV